jgi:DNA-binding NarL/FixJ family response regulator
MDDARILIADDHPLFRDALRHVCERVAARATFVEAASHRELLAATRPGAPFDLIVVDLMMPGGEEFAELRELRARLPATPTIVVSSRDDGPAIARAFACGIAGYIPKSLPAPAMESAIRTVLGGGSFRPGVVEAPFVPASERAGDVEPLTPRQYAVLERLQQGRSNRQIAEDLGIEEITVKVHISAILRKLHVKNRLEAVVASQARVAPGD